VIDTKLQSRDWRPSDRAAKRADEQQITLAPQKRVLQALVPEMVKAARALAEPQGQELADRASAIAQQEYADEIHRLTALRRVNRSVREQEIQLLQTQQSGLAIALPSARLRLDALRLAVNPSFFKLR
jgi:ATP-dependent helicase HepA